MSNALGIDVSYANAGDTNSPSVAFVIARATYGKLKDSRYAQHIVHAKALGKIVGAYGFGVYGSGYEQAVAFLEAAGDVLFLALDLEVEKGKPRMTDAQAAAFIAYVKAKRGHCVLYHSDSGFPSLGQTANWVAKWGTTQPSRPWRIWQYQGAPLDRDMYHGTVAEMKAWLGIISLPDTSTPTVYWNVAIHGRTALKNRPFGTTVQYVRLATYRCTRSKSGGTLWYRIVSKKDGSPTRNKGLYFSANGKNMIAHLA